MYSGLNSDIEDITILYLTVINHLSDYTFIFFIKTVQMCFLTLKTCPVGLTIQLILISLFFWRPSWIYLFLGYATLFI